jgi:UDP-3-O-[3-hydroxymyristoyl] glucosamine N-acyltransferase
MESIAVGKGLLVDRQTITLGALASRVGGTLVGDASLAINGAAPLYEVAHGQITLLDDGRPVPSDIGSAAAVVVPKRIESFPVSQIVCADPRQAFTSIVEAFVAAEIDDPSDESARHPAVSPDARLHATAVVGDGVRIDANVSVGKRVRIGDGVHLMAGVVVMDGTEIGAESIIFPNVTIYERSRIGRRVTIHAGTVIGAYGFGYNSTSAGHVRTPQLGYVLIEDDVEIGAAVTIDRGTYGSTRIGQGTKIDNQVMIGHNCQIGKHNLLCSQVGIAGSCRTGQYVVLAGQVGLKDHVTLGDGAIVGAQAGVMEDLEGGQVYLGSPATTQREQMQIIAVQRRLPELRRSIKVMEKTVGRGPAERAA